MALIYSLCLYAGSESKWKQISIVYVITYFPSYVVHVPGEATENTYILALISPFTIFAQLEIVGRKKCTDNHKAEGKAVPLSIRPLEGCGFTEPNV
jgi:hypothetical protein